MGAKLSKRKTSNDRECNVATAQRMSQLLDDHDDTESDSGVHFVQSPIERLPHDIMWQLLEYAPKSVHDVRSSSRTLKFCVDKGSAANTPMVDNLGFFCTTEMRWDRDGNKVHVMGIEMTLLTSKAWMFEVLLLRQNTFDVFSRMKKDKYGRQPNYTTFNFDYSAVDDDDQMLEFLGKCIRSRLENVSIAQTYNLINYDAVIKLLEGRTIENLDFTFRTLTEEQADQVLKIVRDLKIDSVSFSGGIISSAKPADFILEISSAVRCLHITSVRGFSKQEIDIEAPVIRNRTDVTPLYCHYPNLLGIAALDWAPTIVEMFSRKLDTLCITKSRSFRDEDLGVLKEQLPQFGKPIWFQAPIGANVRKSNDTVNDHLVTVQDNLAKDGAFVSIKHESRKDEQFD